MALKLSSTALLGCQERYQSATVQSAEIKLFMLYISSISHFPKENLLVWLTNLKPNKMNRCRLHIQCYERSCEFVSCFRKFTLSWRT